MNDLITKLISAAGGRDEDIDAVIASAGLEATARILIDEIVAKFENPLRDKDVQVQFVFLEGVSYLLTITEDGATYAPGTAIDPHGRSARESTR